jgi:protein-S-isoprenylcysteine O-methyltransferase Ste14
MDVTLHRLLVALLFCLAPVTFALLLFVVAPYGRHGRAGWGPSIPERFGWLFMESPALFYFAFLYLRGGNRWQVAPLALCSLWLLHYGQRELVYPFLLRGRDKRMPALIALLSFAFNVLNASVNALQIAQFGSYPIDWLSTPQFIAGSLLFVSGFVINIDADRRLRNLRAPGESGYKIPRGGLHEWVSCPNYLGEIAEWCGWAIATWSWAGAAFALFTIANLAPRALSNHRWYQQRFPDYPKERRALVPFIW